MELLPIMRSLWRHRIVVVVSAIAAISIGATFGRGEATHAGVASARVVLDTNRSQLVHPLPKGSDSLAWRAGLLARLLATEPVRERMANEIRVEAARLVVRDPSLASPAVPTALAPPALEAATVPDADHVLVVRFDPELPIISLETAAPDRAGAARLADAAIGALRAASTPPAGARHAQPFVVQRLGRPTTRQLVTAPSLKRPIAISGLVFCLCCVFLRGVYAVAGVRRRTTTVSSPAM